MTDSANVSYLRDRVLFLLWRLLQSRAREAAAAAAAAAAAKREKVARKAARGAETPEQKRERHRAYSREYMRTHKEEQRERQREARQQRQQSYINPVAAEFRRADRDFGAVNSPTQLETLAYRYFVCRFGAPLRRHRHSAPPYNGNGAAVTFVSRRRRVTVTATVTAVDPVTLHGRLTALDDMHYRAAITVARLEQTIQPS